MIDLSLEFVTYDRDLLIVAGPNRTVEIDRNLIHNIEFDDQNKVVHFEIDEQTAQEYGLEYP